MCYDLETRATLRQYPLPQDVAHKELPQATQHSFAPYALFTTLTTGAHAAHIAYNVHNANYLSI
jgi:hypothetical protein